MVVGMKLWRVLAFGYLSWVTTSTVVGASSSLENCQVTATGETICVPQPEEQQTEPQRDVVVEEQGSRRIDDTVVENHPRSTCSLYLAESTIPGAGLGVFTATSRDPNDPIFAFDSYSDICIPIIDWRLHAGDLLKSLRRPLRDYLWRGDAMGMREAQSPLPANGDEAVQAFCPGLDSLANSHLGVTTVRSTAFPDFDSVEQHRASSTSAGAFSPYVMKANGAVANMKLPPGSELFRNYGESWFTSREYMFGKAPLWRQYETAEALLDHLSAIVKQDVAILSDLHDILMQINTGSWESRALNTLPSNTQDLESILRQGGSLTEYVQRQTVRDVDWLQKNGRCLDNIRVDRATDPSHGHGAFATRDLPAGTIITTSPLQHLGDENVLKMYSFHEIVDAPDEDDDEEEEQQQRETRSQWVRLVDQDQKRQLLLNYCFGHRDSTLLLCPYGAGVNAINHDPYNANVRIQWATGFAAHNHTLIESGSLEDLTKTAKPQLAFDYVAVRDIAAGEELFLDYGAEWQEAWDYYGAEEWTPRRGEEGYANAREWNVRFGHDWPLRDVEDQVWDPYSSHLEMHCHQDIITMLTDNNSKQSNFIWDDSTASYPGRPCRILHRFREAIEKWNAAEDWYYTVEVEVSGNAGEGEEESTVQWVQRTDVPRQAIRFVDKPGSSDLHLDNTFRHDIRIPDEIFPAGWKNVWHAAE